MSLLDEYINEAYVSKHVDQGSEQWENMRAGRFTSSEIYKIMQFGTRPMTKEELKARPKTGKGSKTTKVLEAGTFSEHGWTYIYQKVAEVLTGKPKPSAYAYPLVYGKETEPEAVEFFEKKTGLKCEQVGFQPWSDHSGGSPDRLVEENSGLEIKCPFQSENQVKYLMLTDHWDLKANHPDHYWQCVSLMLFTGRKTWHFCTFDPRMIEDKHKLTHMVLEFDKLSDDVELLNLALAGAIKEKLKLLSLLK